MKLRIPQDLKTQVEWEATLNKRSLNAEILDRIEKSLSPDRKSPYLAKIHEELSKVAEQLEQKDYLIHLLAQFATELMSNLEESIGVRPDVPIDLQIALRDEAGLRPPVMRSTAPDL